MDCFKVDRSKSRSHQYSETGRRCVRYSNTNVLILHELITVRQNEITSVRLDGL
jgi:hypothetical protein